MKMDSINSDLDLLENLSKKISDLIYNNKFNQICSIDAQRRAIIEKIKARESQNNDAKDRIRNLVQNNLVNINSTEKKLQSLSENHNKFKKRFKAYSDNR